MTLLEKGDTAQWVDASKKYAVADEVIAQNLLAYYTEKEERCGFVGVCQQSFGGRPE